MIITSKGNGRNYYGYTEQSESPVEVVKEGGRFYIAKYIVGQGLTAVGNPLKKFTLIN